MIEFIYLQLMPWISINTSPVTVQTQDPWTMFFVQASSIAVGGIIAFGANYLLQVNGIYMQYEKEQFGKLNDLYNELLIDIHSYTSTGNVSKDLEIHLTLLGIICGPRTQKEVNQLQLPNSVMLSELSKTLDSVSKILTIADAEFNDKITKERNWWKFWKRFL